MENPKCLYCGGEMKLWDDGCGMLWYSCPKCLAEAPVAHSEEAAYASAMKRERPKGEWKCESRAYPDYGLWNKWRCSKCGYVRTQGWEHTQEGKSRMPVFVRTVAQR